jgi:hypothetical protein
MRLAAVADGKITLSKLALFMPHVRPALAEKVALMKQVEANTDLPIAYRGIRCESNNVPESTTYNWRLAVSSGTVRPRYIIIAFQTDRSNDQTKNPAVFDHVDLEQISIAINTENYPREPAYLNFTDRQISRGFKDFFDFKSEYYGTDPMNTLCSISPIEYVDSYPIHVVDLRYQMSELQSTQDIVVSCRVRSAVPANTQAYAVMLSDTIGTMKSSGKSFQIAN